MKCFTCDMTPSPCVPAICAAASCPSSSGSSPKVFWARPNVKSRTMLTNGSSTTSWPSALASRAITMPFFRASSRLQVAANPIVDVMPVDHTLTEMPGGPIGEAQRRNAQPRHPGPSARLADSAGHSLRTPVDQVDLLFQGQLAEQLIDFRIPRHNGRVCRLSGHDESHRAKRGDGYDASQGLHVDLHRSPRIHHSMRPQCFSQLFLRDLGALARNPLLSSPA